MNRPPPNPSSVPSVLVIGGANMDIVAHSDALLRPCDSNPGRLRCAAGRGLGHGLC